jgi:nucleotide-binding universal stress UspA family protein
MIPPRVVLTAVDFSDGSRAALAFAARLAVHTRAELHVVHAEDPLLHAAAQNQGLDLARETLEELRRFVDETFPASTCNPRLHAIAGAAPDVILNTAQREQADVLAVGSRGLSGVQRAVFGSTTEYVLRRADVSVQVVPQIWAPPRPDKPELSGVGPVIAATDLSEPANTAAAAAARLAALLGTSLELVHIVPKRHVLERWQSRADASMHEQLAEARDALKKVAQAIAATVPVEIRVEVGDVPEQLGAIAASDPARHPLLVLGRRTGGSRGAAPGAIAYRVLTDARVPILVYLPKP